MLKSLGPLYQNHERRVPMLCVVKLDTVVRPCLVRASYVLTLVGRKAGTAVARLSSRDPFRRIINTTSRLPASVVARIETRVVDNRKRTGMTSQGNHLPTASSRSSRSSHSSRSACPLASRWAFPEASHRSACSAPACSAPSAVAALSLAGAIPVPS